MSVALDAADAPLSASGAPSHGRGDGRLASATVELDHETDPTAIAAGSRLATDRWFCWEQPDRGFALAGIGTAAEVVSRGGDRFADLAAGCSRVGHDRVAEEPQGLPAGAGPRLGHRTGVRARRRERAHLVVAAAGARVLAGGLDRAERWAGVPHRLREERVRRRPRPRTRADLRPPGIASLGSADAGRSTSERRQPDLRPIPAGALRGDRGDGGGADPRKRGGQGRPRPRADGRGARCDRPGDDARRPA